MRLASTVSLSCLHPFTPTDGAASLPEPGTAGGFHPVRRRFSFPLSLKTLFIGGCLLVVDGAKVQGNIFAPCKQKYKEMFAFKETLFFRLVFQVFWRFFFECLFTHFQDPHSLPSYLLSHWRLTYVSLKYKKAPHSRYGLVLYPYITDIAQREISQKPSMT